MQIEQVVNGQGLVVAEIRSDGRTVWVQNQALLGRFGRFGIDIHKPISEQKTGGECLYCTHRETTWEDWCLFVRKMEEYYGIKVHVRHKPARINLRGSIDAL